MSALCPVNSTCRQVSCVGAASAAVAGASSLIVNSELLQTVFAPVGTIGQYAGAPGYEQVLGVCALLAASMLAYCALSMRSPDSGRQSAPSATPASPGLIAIDSIDNPRLYFEQTALETDLTLRAEMQNYAIQALLRKEPNAVSLALTLANRMPGSCLQRDYALHAISLSQATQAKFLAFEIAAQMTHPQYYALTINMLDPDMSDTVFEQLMQARFPAISREELADYRDM